MKDKRRLFEARTRHSLSRGNNDGNTMKKLMVGVMLSSGVVLGAYAGVTADAPWVRATVPTQKGQVRL